MIGIIDQIKSAKNERIEIGGTDCYYISFGTGRDPLIILPGVGDGFKTAKGVAVPFAMMYRNFGRYFKVFVFSRRNDMPVGFTTADMADDLDDIMQSIGIDSAHVFGVSQGGMISQQLAIRHPDRVKSLVLAVTASQPNDTMKTAIGTWLDMSNRDDYRRIMVDTAERSYTGAYLRRGRVMNKALAFAKPKDYTRFKILAKSCLEHDVYDELGKIECPTLILGASRDKIVSAQASVDMHEKITGSELYMYEGYSHGVYEQAKDFNDRVLAFLLEQQTK